MIYRCNVIFELYKYCMENKIQPEIFMMCKNIIEKAEAVDAVTPVVRCAVCKYASEKQVFTCFCELRKDRMPLLDGFCSEGRIKAKEVEPVMDETE